MTTLISWIAYTQDVNLSTPLRSAFRTPQKYLDALKEIEIRTVEDLLNYLPRAHEDLSSMVSIETAPLDQKVTIRGTVSDIKLVHTRSKKKLVTGVFSDTNGQSVDVIWFNQPHIKRMLSDGDEIIATGKLGEKGYKLQFLSPQFEKAGERPPIHSGRLVPVYPQHDIITTKWLREKVDMVKECIDQIPETLPEEVVADENLISRSEAIRALHFPDDPEEVGRAYDRIAFEEMYRTQCDALERKQAWKSAKQDRLKIEMSIDLIKAYFDSLKFTPTDSQKVAIYEILKDMEAGEPMSRLLEGDVGSGKTLVATTVIANVIASGGQCALMVPTEVLARQHVDSIAKSLINFHTFLHSSEKRIEERGKLPSVALLTGSVPLAQARKVKEGLMNGTVDLVIGTHALLTANVQFANLALVIVDEQHRFGVEQRARLKEKGNPHFLSMTATPIPRTLALTAYGHHDLSVLTEKPGNRQPIETKVVGLKDRKQVENFIDHQIGEGRQAFVICPLIAESSKDEMVEIKNVQQEADRLRDAFPNRRVALLHGKMKPEEKEEIMKTFKAKESDILVSTSVIEVGIDVPNSTIMIIEGAERFGLAQLHQFRGRVGRGDHKSFCFLFTTAPSQKHSQRLKAMEEYDSGFLLAEIDLKLRGPGELYGLRQSGLDAGPLVRFFNPELVVRARRAAEKHLGMRERITV